MVEHGDGERRGAFPPEVHGEGETEAQKYRRAEGSVPVQERGGAVRRALKLAFAITASFMVLEFVGGYVANSLALMADAGHMLSDAAALALAALASHFGAKPATARKTYGWLRLEILAALVNGVTLVLIAGGIFWKAIERFRAPPVVETRLMLGVAFVGLLANVAVAWVLHAESHDHLNTKAAYLHVLGDLAGSVGAILAGLIMETTGWYLADPIVSLFVGGLIVVSAWRVSLQAIEVLLEAVPAHLDLEEIERALEGLDGVRGLHDLHVWAISSHHPMLTVHLVAEEQADSQRLLIEAKRLVSERFGIVHSTVQVEREDLSPIETGLSTCR